MKAVLEQLAAPDFRDVMVAYRDALREHQDELNRLNVYPVPDGDTGTNMALTLESVVGELGDAEEMAEVCRAVSHGSLMGARGNSGVILSQILRGLADTFSTLDSAAAADLVAGLRRAADAAYEAVLRPVEGTILTVARAAADAADAAHANGADLTAILEHVEEAAHLAVERTPELLPVLEQAGVVDAGGRGFELLVDAFLHVVDGRPVPEPAVVVTPPSVAAHLRGDHEVSSLRYEVMYLLEADDPTIPAFKAAWSALGDSIVVVGGDGIWNCHVHTNDVGAAIEAGIDAGRPSKIRVTDLAEQVEEEQWVREHTGARVGAEVEVSEPAEPVATAMVAVAVGTGVQRMLKSLGVHAIVAGGQSMNPSTAQILEAVQRCPSDSIVVLPNNKNIIPVAQQVDGLSDRNVAVVPTHSVIEALAALVAYDPNASIEANCTAMEEAVGRVRTGEVTRAVRDGVAECGPVTAGDWIAVARDGICATASSAGDAAVMLVDRLVGGDTELVTVLLGADARGPDRARLVEHVADAFPGIEIEVHEGDQPLYPFLVGVE